MRGRIGMRPLERGAGKLAAQGEVQSPVPSLTRVSWLPRPHQSGFGEWQGGLGEVGQFGGWEALVELNLNEDLKKRKRKKKT